MPEYSTILYSDRGSNKDGTHIGCNPERGFQREKALDGVERFGTHNMERKRRGRTLSGCSSVILPSPDQITIAGS